MRTFNGYTPTEKQDEIVSMYLSGANSYEELGEYYKVKPGTIRVWVCKYRKSKNIVSLHPRKSAVVNLFRNTVNDVSDMSTCTGKQVTTLSGKEQKTVNQNQEKTYYS